MRGENKLNNYNDFTKQLKTMKRLILMAVSILAAATTAIAATTLFADHNRPIDYNELPAPAKEFIQRYFGDKELSYATLDREVIGTEYNVAFVGGTKLEFDSKGKWTNVECKGGVVPAGIVPAKIADYVKQRYAKSNIVEIKRDTREWEVKLSNGLELTFNSKFRVVDIDD